MQHSGRAHVTQLSSRAFFNARLMKIFPKANEEDHTAGQLSRNSEYHELDVLTD